MNNEIYETKICEWLPEIILNSLVSETKEIESRSTVF